MSSNTTFIHVPYDDEASESQTETSDAEFEGRAIKQSGGSNPPYVATVIAGDYEVSWFVHGPRQSRRLAEALYQASLELLKSARLS